MLEGERVELRPVSEGDLEGLRAINVEPSVSRWWPPGEFDRWPLDDDVVAFAVIVGGVLAGMIQYDEETDPRYRHANVDLFIATSFQGRGIGAEAITVLVGHLIDERGHHRIVIDPSVENERAIRSYTSVGFKPVGVMRHYELDHNTEQWQDGLLMDLLADEFAAKRTRDAA